MIRTRLAVDPPLSPAVYFRRPRPLPFPLEDARCRTFARARQGLWQGIRALGLGSGDTVLVPAYHCGAEVEALARAGVTSRCYEGNEMLEPSEAELDRLLTPDVKALYLIHYLGFPQDAARWSAWARAHGLLLIEDAAQSWLAEWEGRPVGSFGDLAIFCLYKSFEIFDGGAVVATTPAPGPSSSAPIGILRAIRGHVYWFASRVGWLGRDRPEKPYPPERDFALGDPASPPSRLTLWLLHRLEDQETIGVRRRHFELLAERLGHRLPRPFRRSLEGSAPFLFPIESEDKEAELRMLAREGIQAVNFWSAPHPSIEADRFPQASNLRRRVIGLPVHHRLRPKDLERIAAVASDRLAPSRTSRPV